MTANPVSAKFLFLQQNHINFDPSLPKGLTWHFIEVIRDPFCENKFFNLIPRSIVAKNLYAKSLKIRSVQSKNWTKMTTLRSYALCLARGVK